MENKKLRRIYLTTRKNEEGMTNQWFVIDKASKVDFELDTKKEALQYIKENYTDIKVRVQGNDMKWESEITIEGAKVSDVREMKNKKVDAETAKDLKEVFKYVYVEKPEKETIIKEKTIKDTSALTNVLLVISIIISIVTLIVFLTV